MLFDVCIKIELILSEKKLILIKKYNFKLCFQKLIKKTNVNDGGIQKMYAEFLF